jgi:predicted O-linked N-acetylglucosamine transferase (SPINDLY family)
VLAAVPGSRLLLQCYDPDARRTSAAIFAGAGVDAARIEFLPWLPKSDYLRLYERIDLALDPFPYNGMTTTCEALWMGVPVVTLPGILPVSRTGLSLLTTVGLPELAATSENDYVRLATGLAGDLPRLATLRASLRARMQLSPLMDAARFAGYLEAAFRAMWRRWCDPAAGEHR